MDRRQVDPKRMERLKVAESARRGEALNKSEWAKALGYRGKYPIAAVFKLTKPGTSLASLARRIQAAVPGYSDYSLAEQLARWLVGEGSDDEMPRPVEAADKPPVEVQAAPATTAPVQAALFFQGPDGKLQAVKSTEALRIAAAACGLSTWTASRRRSPKMPEQAASTTKVA